MDDGRGGRHSLSHDIDFPHPEPNQAPNIDELEVNVGVRGRVNIQVSHHDPEGQAVNYEVHWGDEDDENATEPLPGGDGHHDYQLPATANHTLALSALPMKLEELQRRHRRSDQ